MGFLTLAPLPWPACWRLELWNSGWGNPIIQLRDQTMCSSPLGLLYEPNQDQLSPIQSAEPLKFVTILHWGFVVFCYTVLLRQQMTDTDVKSLAGLKPRGVSSYQCFQKHPLVMV